MENVRGLLNPFELYGNQPAGLLVCGLTQVAEILIHWRDNYIGL